MIPVCSGVYEIYNMDNEEDLAYKNLVINQYGAIKIENKKGNIGKYANKIYLDKINKSDAEYVSSTVDFEKIEKGCLVYSYCQLSISLCDEYDGKEIIEGAAETNLFDLIRIENGVFSRMENFDKNCLELQKVQIYAKDEFEQEKYIEVMFKIKENVQFVWTEKW